MRPANDETRRKDKQNGQITEANFHHDQKSTSAGYELLLTKSDWHQMKQDKILKKIR